MKNQPDDFCGAAGIMFEGRSSQAPLPRSDADSMELYRFEHQIMNRLEILLGFGGKDQASVSFPEPEALSEEFKRVLLKVLARRKKENLRSGLILTVSHPDMGANEQVPFLAERSEVPALTIRRSTPEDRRNMHTLREIFPTLLDAHNALGSSLQQHPEPDFYFGY